MGSRREAECELEGEGVKGGGRDVDGTGTRASWEMTGWLYCVMWKQSP